MSFSESSTAPFQHQSWGPVCGVGEEEMTVTVRDEVTASPKDREPESPVRSTPASRAPARAGNELPSVRLETGDGPRPDVAVAARAVGLDGAVCPPGKLPDAVKPEEFAVFAGTLPEGKYDLVKAFQKNGHTVGMCGDGANDAPALRQAQLGILSRQQRMWPNPQPVLC